MKRAIKRNKLNICLLTFFLLECTTMYIASLFASIYCWMATIILLLVLIYWVYRKREKDWIWYVMSGIKVSGLSTFLFALFTFLNLGWFTDSLFEMMKGDWNYLLKAMICLCTELAMVILFSTFARNDRKTPEWKVYLSAHSNRDRNTGQYDVEAIFMPITEKPENFSSLQKIIILSSQTAGSTDREELTKAFLSAIETYFKHPIELIFSNTINMDDLEDCNKEIERLIKETDTRDSELLFNYTLGTKSASVAMAIHGLKLERSVCYIDQRKELSVRTQYPDFNIYTFGELFEEMVNEKMSTFNK